MSYESSLSVYATYTYQLRDQMLQRVSLSRVNQTYTDIVSGVQTSASPTHFSTQSAQRTPNERLQYLCLLFLEPSSENGVLRPRLHVRSLSCALEGELCTGTDLIAAAMVDRSFAD